MYGALLLVAGWVGRGMAQWLASARRSPAAELASLHERLARLQGENDLLRARLGRIDAHRRPRYAPWERLRILLHRALYGLSIDSTARAFVVSGQTVMNWLEEIDAGVARLIHARRPVNALPELVGEISLFLKREWPRWGTRRIAGILARLGIQTSRTSVQRILQRPPLRPAARGRQSRSSLRACRPGYVWVIDFTIVRSFFRSVVIGAVLDAYSRKVLALRVWPVEPDAAGACLLLRDAIQTNGRPSWVVSDRGRQFRSDRFKSFLARRLVRRRFVALGDPNLSRIDRFWRGMKDEFARGLFLWKPLRILRRQLEGYVRWHGQERPHQGIGMRAPDDVHAKRVRGHRTPDGQVLELTFIDGDHRLPVFRLRSIA